MPLLDAPTAGLDVESRRGLWTHIRGFVDRGRLVAEGTPADIEQIIGLKRVSCATLLSRERLLGLEAVISVAGEGWQIVLGIADGDRSARALLAGIEMPNLTGLELAAQIRRVHPGVKVLILAIFARPGYLRRALTGVSGYLLKHSTASPLAVAIPVARRGRRTIDPQLAAEAGGEAVPLTDRERQVLRMAPEAAADIAGALRLSEATVRNHLSEAMGKLGAANRIEAASLARQKGCL